MEDEFYSFIPPYYNTGTPVNYNLHLFTAVQPTEGPGDHAFLSYAGLTSPLPRYYFSGTVTTMPAHTENTGVLFHHQKPTDPYTAEGSGVFSNVILSEYGTPWKSNQGIELLWENFFDEHYQIQEHDWNLESDYYHATFGQYLTLYVRDFLRLIPKIVNLTPALIKEAQQDPAECEKTPACKEAIDALRELNRYFPNFLPLITWGGEETDAHKDIVNIYTLAQTETGSSAEDRMQRWYLGTISDPTKTMYKYQVDNPSNKVLDRIWGYFMQASDITIRNDNILGWAYEVMITMFNAIEEISENQALRVTVLTDAQRAATSAIAKVTIPVPKSASDVTGLLNKTKAQKIISIYRNIRQEVQSDSQMQSSAASATKQTFQEETSLISTMIQTLDSVIQFILRR